MIIIMAVISKDDLMNVMLYELAAFNDEGVDLDTQTLHDDVLDDNDGFGAASSKSLYKGSIDWVLWNADYPHRNWPSNWMDMTVDELSDMLLNRNNL